MKLPELHVFQRNAGARRHAQAVAGVDEGVGRRGKNAPRAAGGEHRGLRLQDHDLAGFHLQRGHAQHVTVGVTDKIERHPFDEELRLRAHVALVERMQHRVAGAIGGGASTLHRLLAEVRRMAAERTLVDGAVRIAVEWHAEMLEFVDDLGRHAAHELDRILVAEPVGALDRVVHVPEPVVLATCCRATHRCRPAPPPYASGSGNTLDSTATDSPASASCSDARMPAPPAPTITASNLPHRQCHWPPHKEQRASSQDKRRATR